MAEDLNAVAMFGGVVEAKGFRSAGRRLGVSGSAVSQAVRRLEEQLGMALVQRTTRSVRLTEAGERYYAAVRPALEEMREAATAVGEMADQPRGVLRLNVSGAAESFLSGPALEGFLGRYPDVRLELIVSDEPSDIVAEGYDAGVRLGEVIDQDMVTVPVSGRLRLIVVGAPSYFARHPAPEHPRDLVNHLCINFRAGPGQSAYRWEFTEDGHDFSVAVPARVVTNDLALMLRLTLAGVGLTLRDNEAIRPYIEREELVPVLQAYSTPFPGFYLYYPQRRQAPPPLRALIDFLLEMRRG
jgi:DNA-binding transcriptional LysR family regulator